MCLLDLSSVRVALGFFGLSVFFLMAGPAPKPADRRQRRNKPTALRVMPAGKLGSKTPAPPTGLLATTRAEWKTFWGSELAQLVEQDTDLPALERLFSYYDEHRRAMKMARKERLVVGSKGQTVLNPLLKYTESLAKEIRALEDRFGLTPKARLTLGITFGEAARSLADLNRSLDTDDDEDEDEDQEDPRSQAV